MADSTITDIGGATPRITLTAHGFAAGVEVPDPVTWARDGDFGDGATLENVTAQTVDVLAAGPFRVDQPQQYGVKADDGFGHEAKWLIDITGTAPIPPDTLTITAGEPEPK